MWTPTTRGQHSRAGLRYGSDLTDAEWAVLEPLLPVPCRCGRPRRWPLREIMNAIFLDFAHLTALGGQARIQNAGSAAMKARASVTGRTAPNGPAGPQASRRHQWTSTRSSDGSGFRRERLQA